MSYLFTIDCNDSWVEDINTHVQTRDTSLVLNGNNFAKITIPRFKKEIVYDTWYYAEFYPTQKPSNDLAKLRAFSDASPEVEKYASNIILNTFNQYALYIPTNLSKQQKDAGYNNLLTNGITIHSLLEGFIIDSTRAANKPRIKFYVNDIVPVISNISPQAGAIDHAIENVFSWSFALPEMTGFVYQLPVEAGAEIEWKLASGGTVHTLTSSQQGRITIPANTFIDGTTIQWRLRVKTDDNIWSAWSDVAAGSWFTLTIGDAALEASNLSPSGQYIDASKPYTFSWDYSSGLGRPQAAYEAQINYDNNPGWVPFFSGTGTAQSYIAPANALTGGGMRWKIRVTNDRGTVSNWSEEAQNRVVARPDTPDITGPDTPAINAIISDISRPTITWQAAGQLAFQLLVLSEDGSTLLYDSGIVNTKVTSYKIPIFLDNGRYVVKVRVMNEFAMYSEYGVVNAFIEADKPSPAKLVASSMPNGVRLSVSEIDNSTTSLIIYRYSDKGYIPVVKLDPGVHSWVDYAGVGLTTYFVRTVAGDLFADSEKVTAIPQIRSSIIATVSALSDVLPLKYLQGDFKTYSGNETYGVVLQQFDGRELPVADFSQGMSRPFTFSATLTEDGQLKKLQSLARQKRTVLYRDNSGRKIFGVINVLPYKEYRGRTDVTITIEETHYSEVISIA